MPNVPLSFYSSVWRYAIIASIGWTVLVFSSAFWNIDNLKDQAVFLATSEARANWNKDQAFRRWASRHGGIYVEEDKNTPPTPYLDHLPERDVVTTGGLKLTLMNPAYIMRQLFEEFDELYGIKGKITAQILINPLNKPKGQVVLDARMTDNHDLEITVKDTGRGIAHHDLAMILEPFKQVEDIMSRSHEGSGLGLPLSKNLTELHGGMLKIKSELGVGTTVTLRFPASRVRELKQATA